MSWVANKAILRRGLVAALLLGGAASAAANVLVVRSTGPSARAYPAGRSLPDNTRIVLRAGDMVVILAGGGTRTFRGPGTFSPTGAQGVRTADSGGRRARIGAVRSAGIVPRGPTIWHVDVTQSGNFCLAGSSNVMLWRPDASAPTRLTIAGPAGAPRVVPWPAGQPTRAWPRGTAIASGATYSFSQPGVAVPTRITFRILNGPLNDVETVAGALIANGCEGQLDVLVESQPEQSSGH
ncbi:MAG TPA: hypothetical protein VGO55_13685 [Allosphingosinicella sp.]|nr:hypothetical protein [Allosphingosinicella sp.]